MHEHHYGQRHEDPEKGPAIPMHCADRSRKTEEERSLDRLLQSIHGRDVLFIQRAQSQAIAIEEDYSEPMRRLSTRPPSLRLSAEKGVSR